MDSSPEGNEFHCYSAHDVTHDWYFYNIRNLRNYHVGLDNNHPVYSHLWITLMAFINFGHHKNCSCPNKKSRLSYTSTPPENQREKVYVFDLEPNIQQIKRSISAGFRRERITEKSL